MIKPDTINLAKQGNTKASAALIKNILPEEIAVVKCELQNNCLHLILEAKQVPDRQLVSSIGDRLISLEIESIKKVKLEGKQIGNNSPDWTFELELLPIESGVTASNNSEFIETLRTFKFSSVFPYKEALSFELYKSNYVRILLFFGLFPWVVSFLAGNSNLENIAWILGIYYASIWGIVLHNIIRPPQFSWKNIIKCVLFTALIGIPILLFFQKVPPFNILYAAADSDDIILQIIGFILGVGVLEESCKALPIYLFMLRPGKLKEPLTAAFYGAMSGLGFAIAEGANYSLQYAFSLARGSFGVGDYVLINTVRFISLPLIHAIWAGIVGYFLGLAAINPSRQNAIIFIGLAIAAILHGLYDTFANDVIGLAILTFSILLFVAYLRRSKHAIEEMEQAELKSQKSKAKGQK
ncbi:MAG: PrsW family intramembrane metalloprotease [Prochloraceae cyanobacterium]|nr:PrsW family intramembrane metalloprotease [Prochloraceae cyanobacterium]